MRDSGKVRQFILWFTQFYDTFVIPEYELLEEVNKRFHLSYQLNTFRDVYFTDDDKKGPYKFPQFRDYKGEDGYWVYERTDIQPDPEWTLSRFLEFEEAWNDPERKFYQDNEEFLYLLDYARKNELKEFENYILIDKISELSKKVYGD